MAVTATRSQIAANVRAETARKRKTQADMALLLGITQQAISRRFHGTVPFTADELLIIAADLKVPVITLMGEPVSAA